MTPVQLKCPICEVDASAVTVTPRGPSQDVDDVQCRRCGIFAVAPGHIRADFNVRYVPNFLRAKGVPEHDLARASSLLRRYLSIYTRECSEQGLEAELLNLFDLNSLERLAETYSNTSIAAKPEKLLRLLSRRTQYPGAPASFNAELDYPAVHAVDAAEFAYYARALTHQGLIETPDLPQLSTNRRYGQNFEATITLAGWTKLGATGSASRTAFVAMSFDASLDPAFLDGISRGISDAGLEPLRVDKVHHNEKICDRIVAEIRRSRFLIADVTMQRQGVYFEAGFAIALGLPVIWCCRRDDLANVHFDTRQYNHIVWDQPLDLRQQLADRIKATIGAAH